MQSAGQQDAAKISRDQAQHALDLFNLGAPGMQLALSDFIKDLGAPGSEPKSVVDAFKTLRGQEQQYFGQAEASAPISVGQIAKQGGDRMAKGAVESQSTQVLAGLEAQRRGAARQLKQQETDVALQQRDFDLSNILGIAQGGISTSFGFESSALQAAASNTANPGAGALSGATAGAAAGTEAWPGWGTLIGAVVGGTAGYLQGGG